ncbi:hypothetical protein [Salisaeta longa]|uniref:hypothetical protein n=1 Tax=Salisaeta longa TaxID=503170 RepID=UPI0012FBC9F3|nr:hypothetical protein [Salisaeta longa]
MPSPTALQASPDATLDSWLTRTDWTLHKEASDAVETVEALREGVPVVSRSQLQAIKNTASLCGNPKTFRRFLKKRKQRRARDDKKKKAAFWGGLMKQIKEAEKHAKAAESEVGTLSASDKMRVVASYVDHLVAHCQLRSKN